MMIISEERFRTCSREKHQESEALAEEKIKRQKMRAGSLVLHIKHKIHSLS